MGRKRLWPAILITAAGMFLFHYTLICIYYYWQTADPSLDYVDSFWVTAKLWTFLLIAIPIFVFLDPIIHELFGGDK